MIHLHQIIYNQAKYFVQDANMIILTRTNDDVNHYIKKQGQWKASTFIASAKTSHFMKIEHIWKQISLVPLFSYINNCTQLLL